ncbi:hypothetical protein KH388_00005, partial [Serratia rubidaea]|nr:hypothetical protein [Serratia rubidaea]
GRIYPKPANRPGSLIYPGADLGKRSITLRNHLGWAVIVGMLVVIKKGQQCPRFSGCFENLDADLKFLVFCLDTQFFYHILKFIICL